MQYLPEQEPDRATLGRMVENSEVSRLLKQEGYRYIYVGAGCPWKSMIHYTDEYWVYSSGSILRQNDLVDYFLETTALSPFAVYFRALMDDYRRKMELYAYDKLADIPGIEEPTFVYAHMHQPHPRHIFDRDGSPPDVDIFQGVRGGPQSTAYERYVDELIFVNKKAEALVDELVSKSDIAPVIILQADHGPRWGEEKETRKDILNAYCLPGKDTGFLYETLSPVNSFRIVFNLYFDTDYELLENRYYPYGL
jgi:hypothetical protein